MRGRSWGVAAAVALIAAAPVTATELRSGGKLLLTRGVSAIEGAGGGGLASWALIGGNATRDGIGAQAHATYVTLPDYELWTGGVAVGLFDRVELSFARQSFDTGATGALLGLGRGYTFDQDVFGAKLRLIGDAVYDQDRLLPQIAIGVQHKRNRDGATIRAVGASDDVGTDYYVAATKLLLAQSLVVNTTLRLTDANQLGLLGFGGGGKERSVQLEASAGWLASKRLLIGGEYRSKPDNLGFAREGDAFDLFAAYAVNRHLSVTAAYVDLGPIATFNKQRGLYLSLQAAF
ncbi:MAG: DUF3034 family protein [Sphingomonadaceae bacterium]|nr:DUF3034 family protein [Sphingomonadaceae bacterium]